MHGGTVLVELRQRLGRGLSPRARGNREHALGEQVRLRSIPACTGEPAPLRLSPTHHRVYPRVHGGTIPDVSLSEGVYGLSPRARGNPGDTGSAYVAPGSIPACTGEPLAALSLPSLPEVYPRVHGGTAVADS